MSFTGEWLNQWQGLLEQAVHRAVELRRKLHRCPEPGGMEYETADIIQRELEKMNLLSRRPIPTGICAFIQGGRAQSSRKTIAVRADMDGLPIEEETSLPFASARTGWMHACGHDIHMAVLLGAARILNQMKETLPVNVQLIFQPNEEDKGGAQDMIAAGVLCEGTDCQSATQMILGFHVLPNLPTGSVGIKYGKVHAASIMFSIQLIGKGSHGAVPDQGVDAIAGAAQMISAVQLMVSRELSPVRSGVITFGKIVGGQARNILAEQVNLEGIIRGEDKDTCLLLQERLSQIFHHMAKALRLQEKISFMEGYPALINDTEAVLHVQGAIRSYNRQLAKMDVVGADAGADNGKIENGIIKIHEIQDHTMTVDDFSYYLQEIPGAYFFLGSGPSTGLHTNRFVVDERCIQTGIAALVASICYGSSETS